jgi:hypothetical protein
MSQASLLKKLLKLKGQKTLARFEDDEGDKYLGLLYWAGPGGFIFHEFRDLRSDGLQFWPLKSLRSLTVNRDYSLLFRLVQRNGELKRRPMPAWLKRVKDLKGMLQACQEHAIWPVVEDSGIESTALYLGPLLEVGETRFKQRAYDAGGKWEKAHELSMETVIRVEILDWYSTTFNSYMKAQR